MIRHIVFFTAKDPQDVEKIASDLSMLGQIPHSLFFEVGINRKVDRLGSEVDVIVYGEFENEEKLEAYKEHPIYEECIRRVRPLREMRVAADFDSVAPRPLPGVSSSD